MSIKLQLGNRTCTKAVLTVIVAVASFGCGNSNRNVATNKVLKKTVSNDAIYVYTKPNTDLALPDDNYEFIGQGNKDIEVLKGWMVKYDAIQVSNVKWYMDDEITPFSTDNPLEKLADKVGTFKVKMEGTKNATPIVATQNLVVAEVQSVKFELKADAKWIRHAIYKKFVISPIYQMPKKKGMVYSGVIDYKPGSPKLKTLVWGWVQKTIGTRKGEFEIDLDSTEWDKSSPKGAFVLPNGTMPKRRLFRDIPDWANDWFPNFQWYGFKTEQIGDKENSQSDSPGMKISDKYTTAADPFLGYAKVDSSGKDMLVKYRVFSQSTFATRFVVYQTVFSSQNDRFVPLMEQEWKLNWDTNDAGDEWEAKIVDQPKLATTKMIHSSISSHPYNELDPLGEEKVIKKK